jgi:hypothetical protein
MITDQFWQLFAMVCVGPGMLFVGVVGAVALLRAMGARWPWERERERGNSGRRRYDTKVVRTQSKYIASNVLRAKENGWLYTGCTGDGPELWDLHFIREVEI